jgi:hypothetical protein
MNGVPDFMKASSRGQGCLAEYACSFDVLIYNKVRIQSEDICPDFL